MAVKLITEDTLKSWGVCDEGLALYRKTHPKGGTLAELHKTVTDLELHGWANWLYEKCRTDEGFKTQPDLLGIKRNNIGTVNGILIYN